MCAERSAIFAAVASGETSFEVIAVAAEGEGEDVALPCGACRQVMEEFEIPWVVLANTEKKRKLVRREDLLPMPFKLKKRKEQVEENE